MMKKGTIFQVTIILKLKANLIRRCIINIIGNGLSYGDKILKTKKSVNSAIITIEDNGPGTKENIQMYLNHL